MRTTFTSLLSLVGVALASSNVHTIGNPFFLHPVHNSNVNNWAVIASPVVNGEAVIEIQRPTVFQSNETYLVGTNSQATKDELQLKVQIDGQEFSFVIASTAAGHVSKVELTQGEGSNVFGLDANDLLLVNGQSTDVWFACPVRVAGEPANPNFVLFYGPEAVPRNFPKNGCQSINLKAAIASN